MYEITPSVKTDYSDGNLNGTVLFPKCTTYQPNANLKIDNCITTIFVVFIITYDDRGLEQVSSQINREMKPVP
jgi:hypothetical protein